MEEDNVVEIEFINTSKSGLGKFDISPIQKLYEFKSESDFQIKPTPSIMA